MDTTDQKNARRAERYAAKFAADHDHLPHTPEPTDDALAESLDRCVRPAPAEMYPAIRSALEAFRR